MAEIWQDCAIGHRSMKFCWDVVFRIVIKMQCSAKLNSQKKWLTASLNQLCTLAFISFIRKKKWRKNFSKSEYIEIKSAQKEAKWTIAKRFTFFGNKIKPDFHSRFSLVASEIFRMGHAQGGETNRTGRKNIFRYVRIWSSNISTFAKFS